MATLAPAELTSLEGRMRHSQTGKPWPHASRPRRTAATRCNAIWARVAETNMPASTSRTECTNILTMLPVQILGLLLAWSGRELGRLVTNQPHVDGLVDAGGARRQAHDFLGCRAPPSPPGKAFKQHAFAGHLKTRTRPQESLALSRRAAWRPLCLAACASAVYAQASRETQDAVDGRERARATAS